MADFDHALLHVDRPLTDMEQIELRAEMALHAAEQPLRFEHVYDPKESTTDPFVRRQHKAAKGRKK